MKEYGIGMAFTPVTYHGRDCRCSVRACIFPALRFRFLDQWTREEHERNLCGLHLVIGSVPFSMEYEDADALLPIPKHGPGRGYKDAGLPEDNKFWTTWRKSLIPTYGMISMWGETEGDATKVRRIRRKSPRGFQEVEAVI